MSQFARRCLVGLLWLSASAASPGAPAANEYQIKAAFLYNFANFITWPESAFDSKNSPFIICIAGKDPFGSILDVTITTENATAKGRPLKVQRLGDFPWADSEGELLKCHILYIGESEVHNLEKILRIVRQYAILTVSDLDTFIDQCGMVRFFAVDNKIRLEIQPSHLGRVGLKADANLLKLSRIPEQGECQP